MVEDRQKICKLLVPVLREVNGFQNLLQLEYRADREIVYIIFATGYQIAVDAGSSGAQMLENIVKAI